MSCCSRRHGGVDPGPAIRRPGHGVFWPQLHIARGALLAQCGRHEDAVAAYRGALALEPAGAIRRHITGQIAALGAAHTPTEEA
jgi:hypothetical protein